MKLNIEPKPVLAVCLNPAWERRLFFNNYIHGGVNRAYRMDECGGGKGVNVLRTLRSLGFPCKVALFSGGENGSRLRREIGDDGIFVEMKSEVRGCCELIDESSGTVTEIIEPTPSVSEAEKNAMLDAIGEALCESGVLALCGTACSGIDAGFMSTIAEMANAVGIPLLVDSVCCVESALEKKVALLKVNREEICSLGGADDICSAARSVMEIYSGIDNVAVTSGGDRAFLFSRKNGSYGYDLPVLEGIVSPIGAGDCATAVMARRLSEGETELEISFAEALACASASCLDECPSCFKLEDAARLLEGIRQVSI